MEDSTALNEFLKAFYQEGIYMIEDRMGQEYASSDLPETKMAKEPEVGLSRWNKIGGYSQHILILVDSSKDTIIGKDDLHFLEKVLDAIKRSLENVLIVNVHGVGSLDLERLFREREPRKVLAFGVFAGDCGHEDCVLYEVAHIDKTTWLFADDLHGINNDVSRKKAFWKALKEMFL